MTVKTKQLITKKISLPSYTFGEEMINSLSHAIGTGLSIAGLVILLMKSISTGDPWKILTSILFGTSLILLYCMSTLYHALPATIIKRIFRVFDHCTIFVLIAGTYTPFTLVSLRDSVGWLVMIVIWLAAITGIVLNAIDVERFAKASMVCYLAMGWCIVLTFRPLISAVAMNGILLLIASGVAYTIGAILYGIGSKHRYMHSVWHFFVLAGSILHFLSVYYFVL